MPLLLIAALALAQASTDWPRFRGPSGDGVAAPDADPPAEWSETKNVAWKTALPARGRSSPVLLGDRIFLTGAREREIKRARIGPDDMQTTEHVDLCATCVDRATGKILWEVVLRPIDKPDPVHWLNSWATPTPVVTRDGFFCDFGPWGTWCLEPASGKILWEKKVPLDHQVGPASSLGLTDKFLILVRDGRDAQYVAALDLKTGEQVWRTERPEVKVPSPNSKKSFSSPILIESGGRRQIVAVGPHWTTAYDPETGKELWRLRHGDGYSIGSVPVFGQGTLYMSTGCARPNMLALRVDGEGDVSTTHLLWRAVKGIPVMSSPLLAGNDLLYVSDEGVASCADPKTGTLRWQERLGEPHYASPLFAGGRIYFFGRDGKTTVTKPGASFERVAENKLDGLTFATPAIAGKALYLRTDTHLYRIEGR